MVVFRSLLPAAVALSLAGFNHQAEAIGLGNPPSQATLNQPLMLVLPVLDEQADLHRLNATLATRAQHNKLGLEFPSWLPDLYFDFVANDGNVVLQITSRQPIKEPIVNFLVSLDYQGATLFKEITLLLDPPILVTRPEANDSGDKIVSHLRHVLEKKAPQASNTNITVSLDKDAQQSTSTSPLISKPPKVTIIADSVKVTKGQTLWNIARHWPVADKSIEEKVELIYQANPQAFIGRNVNRLKANVTLTLHSASTVITASTASKIDAESTLEASGKNHSLAAAKNLQQESLAIAHKQNPSAAVARLTENPAATTDLKKSPVSLAAIKTGPQSNTVTDLTVTNNQSRAEQSVTMQHRIRDLKDTIQQQRAENTKLKAELLALESTIADIELQQAYILNSNVALASKVPQHSSLAVTNLLNTPAQSLPVYQADLTPTHLTNLTGTQSRASWIVAIWIAAALTAIFVMLQFIGKRRIEKFVKELDDTMDDIIDQSQPRESMGHTIRELSIPANLSTPMLIKYLKSAADFYLRCRRFDLAKELVNESLIQYSGNSRVVSSLLKIRQRIYQSLDQRLQTDIVRKIDSGQFPKAGMILESIDADTDIIKTEFIDQWRQKVSNIR